jgi:poly(A) polymerase
LNIKQLKTFTIIQLAYQLSLECGVPIYLVGGAVRDVLMGFFNGKDFDFTCGKSWERVTRLFAEKTRGKVISWDFNQKRVIVRSGENTITVDFAKFKGGDIEDDLLARDFTVNSMAVAVDELFLKRNPRLIDPLDGEKHLAERIIKADSPSVFDQDPLRILRAIRFAAAFKFSIEDKTKSLLRKKASLISMVAAERTKRELFAMLDLERAPVAVQQLVQLGVIQQLIPELRLFFLTRQGLPHQYTLLQHSLKTIEFLADMLKNPEKHFKGCGPWLRDYFKQYIEEGSITRRALLVCAGFLHDSGKTMTRTYEGKTIRFYGHEAAGAALNQEISRRMLLGKKARRILEMITRNHMRILQLATGCKITERAIIRLLRDIKEAPLEVVLLALADTYATSTDKGYKNTQENVKQLVRLLLKRYSEPDHAMPAKALVTGNDIMQIMGIPEGRAVGKILREIHEGERTGLLNSRQEVITWLKKKKRSKSSF